MKTNKSSEKLLFCNCGQLLWESEVFCAKSVIKTFYIITKFTGKNLRWSLFLNKVAG